ncbi:DUF4134 family protein [Pedobacter aquatilis]|uniref:DUF4134 family protein n=1 Tax=Pedobacter aquatilis TaxID=351343 RepID=UPI0029308082|nr:DUF4134 family protein [Pedobacter aquatilis]
MKVLMLLRKVAAVTFFLCMSISVKAQPGISEFYSASAEVHRWYFSLSDLVLAIGAIAGILGGLRVYANWQMGKHHIDAQVMGWFFSCLFLSVMGVFLRGLFGL